MMIIEFLQNFLKVLKGYFKRVEEESIKDNFVIIYELLDEAIDNGYIQCVDINILKEYIKTDYHELVRKNDPINSLEEPPLTNAITWRKSDIYHRTNECFLDVIEKIHFTSTIDGQISFSEILGLIKVNSKLSGKFLFSFNFLKI